MLGKTVLGGVLLLFGASAVALVILPSNKARGEKDPIRYVKKYTEAHLIAAEARRQAARREREFVLARLKEQNALVDYMREWTGKPDMDRYRIAQRDALKAPLFDHWRQRRAAMLQHVVNFPVESGTVIANGKALNSLLEACGETADYRVELRKNFPDSSSLPANSAPLDPRTVDAVRYRRGLSGPKLTGRLDRHASDALDLEWPLVLRHERFARAREAIENAREQALAELETGPISPATAAALVVAVERLRQQIRYEANKKAEEGYPAALPFYRAEKHLHLLSQGTTQFVCATRRDHVQVPGFDGETVEELIAFMHRNHLRFAEADENGQLAYAMLFRQMLKFYVELQVDRAQLAEAEGDLRSLERRRRELDELELGIRTSATEKLLLLLQGREALFD